MKTIIYSIFLLLICASCDYDNYDPPKSELTGQLVFKGDPVGVRQGLNVMRLYEPGWENFEPIGLNVKQDGSFSATLFDGNYQLVLIKGNGPWADQADTINFQVKGSKTLDVQVQHFFMIRNEKFELIDSTLRSSFNLEHIVGNTNLQYVSLMIGETMLVDNQFKAREKRLPVGEIQDISQSINLELDLSDVKQDFVFARIGVKTQGNPELNFSKVQKIELQ